MSGKAIRTAPRLLLLSCTLCGLWTLAGLCPAAPANTTMVPMAAETGPRFGWSQDLTLVQPPSLAPAPPAASVSQDMARRGRIRVGLLLPLRSANLRGPAEMVRAGFQAAQRRDGTSVDLGVIETGDDVRGVVTAYRAAVLRYDVIVGPLSRSAVAAVASSGAVDRPTLALALPDVQGDTTPYAPPNLLVMGLSVEDEARQAADWAMQEHGPTKALIVTTGVLWQRRAARAFTGQWRLHGGTADIMDLSVVGRMLNKAGLADLKKRLQGDPPSILFAAVDAGQARQICAAIDSAVPLYGTSQINVLPLAIAGVPGAGLDAGPDTVGRTAQGIEPGLELNGVRLLDLPWQLQADHPAVMIYPRPPVSAGQQQGSDAERLYALGIDAFRVAAEIGAGRTAFTLDGVTGMLAVQFDGVNPARFERIALRAVYRDGVLLPVMPQR